VYGHRALGACPALSAYAQASVAMVPGYDGGRGCLITHPPKSTSRDGTQQVMLSGGHAQA
jgi:hypothetical protein